MKIEDVKYLRVEVTIREYDEHPEEYIDMILDVSNGEVIEGLPLGDVYDKVSDTGTYTLYDEDYNQLSIIDCDYVPNKLIPGEYGDYIDLEFDGNFVTNWITPNEDSYSEFMDS